MLCYIELIVLEKHLYKRICRLSIEIKILLMNAPDNALNAPDFSQRPEFGTHPVQTLAPNSTKNWFLLIFI